MLLFSFAKRAVLDPLVDLNANQWSYHMAHGGMNLYFRELPSSLTTLSIVHCHFFNLEVDKSPFFGIHDAVPHLTSLDISWNPSWVTNHSLGSICKCPELKLLNLRGCLRMGELFAYTALATR